MNSLDYCRKGVQRTTIDLVSCETQDPQCRIWWWGEMTGKMKNDSVVEGLQNEVVVGKRRWRR